ncbi:hypothetical protein Pst134EA_001158 [Puccinia striiformis f. sp. tritici]|uniref:hypothetical protein n=1 Tax=Puccinia striiformis f. sp. tritici TaxID=168172 RepID=UPI0020085AF8|nr:hypothetical protein Pst134EA_001158 [Puccinia striiformis f. sp. tritici]KAH9474113.1 hypothetical protein Pst134EA_001158 [Puccinia striiformis f. sp. tritici]KAI9626045.1 hypothetical protein H4Q26_016033 [Puccinia striiformis f. sp. tritici PST-130]
MYRFSIILLTCSALRYTLAAPIGDLANLPPSHVAMMDSPLPLPPLQFTLGHDNQIRHRKLLAPKPEVMESTIPDAVNKHGDKIRKPSPEQTMLIEDFLAEQYGATLWRLGNDDKFYHKNKPAWTLKYFCGRNEIFDEEDYLIYSTDFCNHNSCCLSGICCSSDTPAEFLCCVGTSCAVLGSPFIAAVTGGMLLACCELFSHAGTGILTWMEENASRPAESIEMSSSNSATPVDESVSVVKESLPETSTTSQERMKEAIPSAEKSTRTAASSRDKGPFKYTQLPTSST